MTQQKQPKKEEPTQKVTQEEAKQFRMDAIQRKLTDGRIGAISIDTCIFSNEGYRLEQGILKALEQFSRGDFQLLLSDIVIREMHSHLLEKTSESLSSLERSLNGLKNHWLVSEEDIKPVIISLTSNQSSEQKVKERLDAFVKNCNVVPVKSSDHVKVQQLINRYFDALPPFENKKDKKHEFPDAMILMGLESWAKKQKKQVLYVTTDKGSYPYCENTEYIEHIDNLSDALALIQTRNEHCAVLCRHIESLIFQGKYPDLLEFIESGVENNIDYVSWVPEAYSDYFFEEETYDVGVESVSYPEKHGKLHLKPISFSNNTLVAETVIKIDVEADCKFRFYAKDHIDKDYVNQGSCLKTIKDQDIEIGILLTIDEVDSEEPKFTNVEVLSQTRYIDFGDVRPDYYDQDPYAEDY